MAKNWTVAEAAKEIINGSKEAIVDIGRRFPLATVAITKAGSNALDVLNAFNFVTVRKLESILKDGVEVLESEDDEEIEDPVKDEKPAKEKKVAEKKDDQPKARGRKKKEEPAMNEPEESDDEDYESMSEVELFKLCKSKGIKAAPKQKKQYYLDLLNPADEDSEDDWDEEEEDEKPAKKTSKKAPAKKSKKAAEDEDDDWDI